MFKFLSVIFLFGILLVFLLGFSILRSFKRILFGSGSNDAKKGEQRRKKSNYSTSGAQHQKHTTSKNTTTEDYSSANRKKIFAKDEGEYVDFEEVR